MFLGQAPIAERVLAAAYLDSSAVRAPWLSLPEPMAMRHPQFFRDVERVRGRPATDGPARVGARGLDRAGRGA